MEGLAEVRVRPGVGWGEGQCSVTVKPGNHVCQTQHFMGKGDRDGTQDRAAPGIQGEQAVDGVQCCKDESTWTAAVTSLRGGRPCLPGVSVR